MEGYVGARAPHVRQLAQSLLVWSDPKRDTRIPREAVARMRAASKPVYCVWSGERLGKDYNIDHCFSFAAWPCGDAWNLMPSWKPLNSQKLNCLVTQGALERAGNIIVDWWDGHESASNPDRKGHATPKNFLCHQ